jgi:tetratricopeptide (TPR) repeat protein
MHGRLLLAAAALVSLLFVVPSAAQTPNGDAKPTAKQLTAEYDQAMQAKDWPRAIAVAGQLVEIAPISQYIGFLGGAQLRAGATDEALATYNRALSVAELEKPSSGQPIEGWKENFAFLYSGKGNALLKLRRTAEAVEAYNHAAELSAYPGLAYFNVCAVLYNYGNQSDAPKACRKSLLADPTRADAWFLLGSLLYAESKPDAKGNFAITSECREALEKYLQLAPDGPHAADVKAMLNMAAR